MTNRRIKNQCITLGLIACLILSSILSANKQTFVYLEHTNSSIPLSSSTCRASDTSLHQDIAVTGIRSANGLAHLFELGQSSRTRFSYQNVPAALFHIMKQHTFTLWIGIMTKYFSSGLHPIQTIIQYIHNQDGAKGEFSFR